MNVSEVFIRRPIATSLMMAGIAMFGVIAYRALPVSDLPQVDYPTLNVSASLPGADPSTMASAVASPLERQFTTIAGLDSMVSSSNAGFTNVTLRLSTIAGATVVPTQAVQTGQDGQYVFVVKPDQTVEQRTVTPGQHVDQDTVIEKGLKPGEVVVTEGQLRLENGSKVTTDLNNVPAGGGGGRGRGGRGGGQGGGRRGQ